jgi:hypothetical protein
MTSVISLSLPVVALPHGLAHEMFLAHIACAAMAMFRNAQQGSYQHQLSMVPSVATTTAAAFPVPPKAPTKADCENDDDPDRADDVIVVDGSCATLGKANLVLVGVAVGLSRSSNGNDAVGDCVGIGLRVVGDQDVVGVAVGEGAGQGQCSCT